MTLKTIIETYIIGVIQDAIPLVFGLIVAVTLFGGTMLIWNAGSEERSKQGKQIMFWGLIFLVVAIGLWGFVFVVQQTFGLR